MEEREFIRSYNVDSAEKLSFMWNGKHSEGFEDSNQAFRRRIVDFITSSDLTVPDELLIDILIAESKWAEQAWCVYMKYQLIAERIIKQSGPKYIDEFLDSVFTCFDTYCASLTMNLSGVNINDIVRTTEQRKEQTRDNQMKKLYESGVELFKQHLSGDPAKGLIALTGEVKVNNVKVIQPKLYHRIFRGIKEKMKRLFSKFWGQ
ncbi:hypothetical protein [Paenibacillus sp. SN-8-1]|uniref:hypothetical protein n=1 Tax=Paenibacillus sp. SN-8-1 TaxID=3435409 RepID=UPI003D9A63FA